jgi:plasmid stability protein
MTLVLELPPELEARLRAEATRRGMTPEALAVEIITAALARDEEDAATR